VEAASRLKNPIRKSDTVARVGGDEFVVLLENTSNKDKLSQMAESLVKSLSIPFFINNQAVEMGCSIGIATYPQDGTTTDDLLAAADIAMYKAKDKGRSTYEY